MKRMITTVSLAVSALLLVMAPARAGENLSKEEGVSCTTCHDKPGSKLLTDKGKYYELMRTFDGFDEIKSTFGRCTHCHIAKPGSKKLTAEGREMAKVANGMPELREWIRSQHPESEEQEEQQDETEK